MNFLLDLKNKARAQTKGQIIRKKGKTFTYKRSMVWEED